MINTITIRKATKDDLSSVIDLYASDDIDDGDILTVEEATPIFNKFFTYPNYSLYVASMDHKIVGTFELLIMDNLGHKGKPSGIVEDVVVDKNYRSLGIGAKMMEQAISICREYGCYKLTLSSNLKRNRAHEFYEKNGFIKHGYSFLVEIDSNK